MMSENYVSDVIFEFCNNGDPFCVEPDLRTFGSFALSESSRVSSIRDRLAYPSRAWVFNMDTQVFHA